MKIGILEEYLDKITLVKEIVYPEFDYTNGISFLFYGSQGDASATLFVGTLSVWRSSWKRHRIKDNATYLICNDEPEADKVDFSDLNANFFLLNTSMDVLLHRLDQGITLGFTGHQEPLRQVCRDFMEDLKNGYLSTLDAAKTRFEALYYPVHEYVAGIIIQSDAEVLTMDLKDRVELALTSFFPETNFFFYEKAWIVFYTQAEETSEKLDFSYEDFSSMLKSNHLYAAISYPCPRPDVLYQTCKVTSMALSVALRMSYVPEISRVYTYKELNLIYLVHLGSQRFRQRMGTNNLMYLTHPDSVKIYYHDIGENDNLLDILVVYLSTAQNITEAAKRLYMHRNTLHNKINKIKELIKLDLTDGYNCSLMLLSCTLLQYQKSSTKMDVTDFL